MKFSITIPAYKKRYLHEAIESCLAQSYPDYEVIIVDDASPEDLFSIVSLYNYDSRIRYYRNEKNCGAVNVVDNWNICLKYCTGDYVICMGDDDRLLPCCLEEYAKLIKQYPGIGVIHGWTEIIDEKGEFLSMQQSRPLFEGAMSVCWNRWNGRNKQYIGDWCFNVALLRQDGGFYKIPLAWGSDDISAVRAASYHGVANTQVLCFQYRKNRYNITSIGNTGLKMDAILEECNWYKQFLKTHLPQDEIEKKYAIVIQEELEQHFRTKCSELLTLDMRQHSLNLFYWLKYRKKYNISILRILYAWKNSFEKRFHGK